MRKPQPSCGTSLESGIDEEAIEAAYRKKEPFYERLCREVVVNLEELVKESVSRCC